MTIRMIRRISAVFLVLVPALAQAAPQPQPRTFVSAKKGSDASNCSRTSPCRTFSRAIAMTTPGGEVVVLDSGGYGAVTISQAVSLVAPDGVYAGITVSSGDAITVAAGVNDVVVLRGLTLVGSTAAGNGINVVSAGTVHVEHCTIRGFAAGNGILATQGVSLQQLYVEDSEIAECNDAVNVQARALSFAWIDRCRFEGGASVGLLLEGPSDGSSLTVSVNDCHFTGADDGIEVGDNVFLTLDHCSFWNFASDILADGTRESSVTISNCVIPNTFAGVQLGDRVEACSMGNNIIAEVRGAIQQCPLR